MNIRFGTIWVADDTARAFNIGFNGRQLNQEAQFLRAAQSAFYDRGNRSVSISFETLRPFATILEAEVFLAEHLATLPTLSTLLLRCGVGSTQDVILQSAVVDSVDHTYLGLSVRTRYGFRAAGVSAIVTTPADDEVVSGTFAIPSSVSSVTVTGLGLSVAPVRVLADVRKPSGGYNLFATVIDGTFTMDGFQASLSATTPDANYKLDFALIQ